MSQAANRIWKGHSCGLVLKLLHSWARWVGAQQGGHGWPGANICPKHPVWPRESSLAAGKLSHLVLVSSVVWKGAAENGILLSHCSSLDVLSHGGLKRGENRTTTEEVQKNQPLSWPRVGMTFVSPAWGPLRGGGKQRGAGLVWSAITFILFAPEEGPGGRPSPAVTRILLLAKLLNYCCFPLFSGNDVPMLPGSSVDFWSVRLEFCSSTNMLSTFPVLTHCATRKDILKAFFVPGSRPGAGNIETNESTV